MTMLWILAVLAAVAFVGCGKHAARATTQRPRVEPTHPYIVATLPPRTAMSPRYLGWSPWTLTQNMRKANGGPGGYTDYEYVGTGTPDSALAKLVLPVTPGTIYAFSVWVDPSHVTRGQFDLFIDPTNGKFSYAVVWGGAGFAGHYATAPWRCPPGVTHVLLGMQTVQTTVARGELLRFSRPAILSLDPSASAGH